MTNVEYMGDQIRIAIASSSVKTCSYKKAGPFFKIHPTVYLYLDAGLAGCFLMEQTSSLFL
jgi:hypothetical protein